MLLTVALFFWLYWLWTRRDLYKFALRFPGYLGLPILGILVRVWNISNLLRVFSQVFEETKAKTACIWMGLYPVVITKDPVLALQILCSPDFLTKGSSLYKPVYNAYHGGLIASPVTEWRHNRRMLNPAFGNKVLLSLLPIFNKAKNLASTKMEEMVDGAEHEVMAMLKRISLGVSVETTMGRIMKEGDQDDDDLVKNFSYAIEKTTDQMMLSSVNLDGLYRLHRRYQQTLSHLKIFVNGLIMENIEKRKKTSNQRRQQNLDECSEADGGTVISMKKTPHIFIDQAIELYEQKNFAWHSIFSESWTMVTGSFETTALGVYSTLTMLAMHPEVQDRLFDEILQVFPEKTFDVEYEHLNQLAYLDMIIKETLRLAPSVPMMARQVSRDTQLGEHLVVPKHMQIGISIYNLHRCEDIWGPQAHKFDPDNFLPGRLSTTQSKAYMPFSKGVRNCIGWRYALLAIKVMLVGLLRNYKFTTSFKFRDLQFLMNIKLRYLEEPAFKIEHRQC